MHVFLKKNFSFSSLFLLFYHCAVYFKLCCGSRVNGLKLVKTEALFNFDLYFYTSFLKMPLLKSTPRITGGHSNMSEMLAKIVALKKEFKKLLDTFTDSKKLRKVTKKTRNVAGNNQGAVTVPGSTAATPTKAPMQEEELVLEPRPQELHTIERALTMLEIKDGGDAVGVTAFPLVTDDASPEVTNAVKLGATKGLTQDMDHLEPTCEFNQNHSSPELVAKVTTAQSKTNTSLQSPRVTSGCKIEAEDATNDEFAALRTDSALTASTTSAANEAYLDNEAQSRPCEDFEDFISIPMESELAQKLRRSVLDHRTLKVLEHDADLQLASLEDQAGAIAEQILDLQSKIGDLKAVDSKMEQAGEIDSLYGAIPKLREAEGDNWKRRQRVIRHMSELYQNFRDDQCALFDHLDAALVAKELIPPEACSIPTAVSSVASNIPVQILRRTTGTVAKAPETQDDSDQAAIEANTRAYLLNDFVAKRKELAACEMRFDNKEDFFDDLEEARRQQLIAGDMVETSSDFDFYLYHETQQMTRDLIDAEADYEVSKAAAVAAGIQLRYSDLESGFVDDADDGYRISMEREMIEECDHEEIESWLMDVDDKGCATQDLSVRESGFVGMVSEGKELKAVEISDSVSLVAEGPSRRRIDRWNTQLA